MIPKVIHYCWFGLNPLNNLSEHCIQSWRDKCPDYEIKRWDESNYDVHKIPYISEAYQAKKYAFVSDYARFDILNKEGGVYFDTDVELIRDISPIIERGAFLGVETGGLINTGLGMACNSSNPILIEILSSYENDHFIQNDGSYNYINVVSRVSMVFMKHGFKANNSFQSICEFNIYPEDYFCPKNMNTGKTILSSNTYSIHHYDGSWLDASMKEKNTYKQQLFEKYGDSKYAKRMFILYSIKQKVKEVGLLKAFYYYIKKYLFNF